MGGSADGGLAACLVHRTMVHLLSIDGQSIPLLDHRTLSLRKSSGPAVPNTDPSLPDA